MAYFYLALCGILSGGIVFGAKVLSQAGASLFEIMIYPNLLSWLVMSFAMRGKFSALRAVPLPAKILFSLSLFMVAVGQYAPLFLNVPVALVVLLMYLQPIWTILIERFYFRRQQSRLTWFLVFFMVIGLILLINPDAGHNLSPWGVLLAVLAGMGISLWLVVSQYFSRCNVSPIATFWAASLYALIPLFLLYAALSETAEFAKLRLFSFDLPPALWLGFLLYTLFCYILPNLLLFSNNRHISAVIIGMLLLLEPVTGVFLDWLFLGTQLTWNILLGGAVILISNAILVKSKAV